MSADVLTIDNAADSAGKPLPVGLDSAGFSDLAAPAARGSSGSMAPQPATRVSDSAAVASSGRVWSDLIQLTKPRIVTMILVTTVTTALIGSGGFVPFSSLLLLLVATGAVAASAGAANQIWERAIDRRMTRTANRPLAAGRLGVIPAIGFTALLGVTGTWILANQFGWVPALSGVATWVLYVVAYTPMKTRSAWNTTIGAVAGALPMLIGYTATGGSLSHLTAWLLVGVLMAWQYPHFMAIAWIYRKQYGEAGFQMTTTVEPTGRSAGLQSVVGSITLLGCAIGLCWIQPGVFAASLATIGVVASAMPMLRASIGFLRNPADVPARRLLRSSLLVLPSVLLIVTLRVFW